MDRTARIYPTQYISCQYPIESGGLERLVGRAWFANDETVMVTRYPFNEKGYQRYLKGIARGLVSASSQDFNYIYRFTKPLRIFEATKADALFALRKGMVDVPTLISWYPGLTPEEAIDKWNFSRDDFMRVCLYAPFSAYYDGVERDPKSSGEQWGRISVWQDVLQKHTELVDGNVMRFVRETPLEQPPTVPDTILDELVDFTRKAGRRISPATRKWLRENVRPPYGSIRVYRGIALDGSTFDELDKSCRAYFKIGLAELHRGAPVVLTRGRDSSWSTTPQVSREFANLGTIKVLVAADLDPGQITVDLNLLPLDVRRKFTHFSQNEVIAAPGKIRGSVAYIAAFEHLTERFEGKGRTRDPELEKLTWVPRYGIVPKERAVAARVLARHLESRCTGDHGLGRSH